MKTASRLIIIFFHPLLMPTIGLLIILNSGTYLSLLDPAAKRAVIIRNGTGDTIFSLDDDPRTLLQESNLFPAGCQQGGALSALSDHPDTLLYHLCILSFAYP